jgi:porin
MGLTGIVTLTAYRFRSVFSLLALVVVAHAVSAQEAPESTNSFDETRAAMSARGFAMEAVVTTDVMALLDGGLDTGVDTPANFDLVFTQDTAAAGWWPNGSFLLYFLGNTGGDPTARTGDLQTASNIEAFNTLKVYEASYEHRFADSRLAVLVGLHDMNSDFYALEHAGLFLNSSFGIGPDVSQTSPSIFSTSALGTRLRVHVTDDVYFLAAIYDGIPGDPDNAKGTHVKLDDGDGVFYINEIGVAGADDHYYKYSVGTWYHSAEFEDFAALPQEDNKGMYFLAERDITRDEDGQGTGVFVQLGLADGDRNQVGRYLGIGMTHTGLLPGRPEDVAGLAIANASNSGMFRALNPGIDRSETAIELSYLITPAPWFTVQPDLQYIINPGMDPGVDDALVASLRFQFAF